MELVSKLHEKYPNAVVVEVELPEISTAELQLIWYAADKRRDLISIAKSYARRLEEIRGQSFIDIGRRGASLGIFDPSANTAEPWLSPSFVGYESIDIPLHDDPNPKFPRPVAIRHSRTTFSVTMCIPMIDEDDLFSADIQYVVPRLLDEGYFTLYIDIETWKTYLVSEIFDRHQSA